MMKIFVAGGSGAIGRPLVRELVAAGHEVTAMTRREERRAELEALEADVVHCDVFDHDRLLEGVADSDPDVVINELTNLPQSLDPRKLSEAYAANNRVRLEGTRNLLEAARAAGARRMIAQSAAFWYAPDSGVRGGSGAWATEDDPMFVDCPPPVGQAAETMAAVEQLVLGDAQVEGVVLRYGIFYGPGTWYAAEGDIAEQVRRRRYPIIGRGEGFTSFVHIEDAARATVAALDGAPGIYNVVDDEPARIREWLPEFARALGAKPPRRVPEWLVRPLAGKGPLVWMRSCPGASNAKAKGELGWRPRFPSWRRGFAESLAEPPAGDILSAHGR